LEAKEPETLSSQKVPATAQQHLPAFLPQLTPLTLPSIAAGQTPNSFTLAPPGSLPHFLTSQQFFFAIENPLLHRIFKYAMIIYALRPFLPHP
jgi:hypothetical protein